MNFQIYTSDRLPSGTVVTKDFLDLAFLPIIENMIDDIVLSERQYPVVRIINEIVPQNIVLDNKDYYVFIERLTGEIILPDITTIPGQEISITNLSGGNITLRPFQGDIFKTEIPSVVLRNNFTYKYIGYKIEDTERGIWINIPS